MLNLCANQNRTSMKTTLLVVGRTVEQHFITAINDYVQRTKRYLSFEMEVIPELKNTKSLSMEVKKEKAEALSNMDKLGIAHLKKRCYRELSGGQQQRVLLARALCATDNLLILDEPVTGLDPSASIDLYDEIKKLNNEGVTIIMVTHDIKNALSYASHILHLEQGKEFFGTVKEYKKSKISDSFLGGGQND